MLRYFVFIERTGFTLKENLAKLIKVKTIVTLAVIAVFSVMCLRGDMAANDVMVVVTSVIAFYFGTQHEKGADSNDSN